MATVLHPEVLRMFERILVVLGGILSIYLGYRLFHAAASEERGQGKLILMRVIEFTATRIGPGVFFALFGAWVLYTSLTSAISTSLAEANAYSDAMAQLKTDLSEESFPSISPPGAGSMQAANDLEELQVLVEKLPPDQAKRADTLLNALREELVSPRTPFFYGYEGPELHPID